MVWKENFQYGNAYLPTATVTTNVSKRAEIQKRYVWIVFWMRSSASRNLRSHDLKITTLWRAASTRNTVSDLGLRTSRLHMLLVWLWKWWTRGRRTTVHYTYSFPLQTPKINFLALHWEQRASPAFPHCRRQSYLEKIITHCKGWECNNVPLHGEATNQVRVRFVHSAYSKQQEVMEFLESVEAKNNKHSPSRGEDVWRGY